MKTLIIIGGFVWVGLFVFHALFWRLFDWKNDLENLTPLNKSVMQVMNLALMVFILIFGYVSFFHAEDLLTTSLGRTILIGAVVFGTFRTILQFMYFDLRDSRSKFFLGVMIVGTMLYLVPLVSLFQS